MGAICLVLAILTAGARDQLLEAAFSLLLLVVIHNTGGYLLGYWGATTRTYHHTAPTNSLYALHEALRMVLEEGLQARWARHAEQHEALKGLGLRRIGHSVERQDSPRVRGQIAVVQHLVEVQEVGSGD